MNTIELAYRRFSRKRFPLPTDDQVRALEDRIEIEFPRDYRQFILEFNGGYFIEPQITPVGEGCPQDALTFLSGFSAFHHEAELADQSMMGLFDDNDPLKILPVGATGMGGLIILDTAPGEGRGDIYLKKGIRRLLSPGRGNRGVLRALA